MYWFRLARFAVLFMAGGALFLGAIGIPLSSAYLFLRPVRVEVTQTPENLGLPYEDVRFPGDGIELAAWYVPGASNDGVVLAHGIHASRADFLDLTAALHQRGFTVLALDMRGHGASGGTFTTYGFRESKDLVAAVEYLKERGASAVTVVGFSLGAASALQAAALSEDIVGVVAHGSFSALREQMQITGQSLGPLAVLVPLIGLYGSWLGGIDIDTVQPIASVARLGHRPVFFIYGEDDKVVPISNGRRLLGAASAGELWLIPGGGHTESMTTAGDEYYSRIGNFLARALERSGVNDLSARESFEWGSVAHGSPARDVTRQ